MKTKTLKKTKTPIGWLRVTEETMGSAEWEHTMSTRYFVQERPELPFVGGLLGFLFWQNVEYFTDKAEALDFYDDVVAERNGKKEVHHA